MSSKTVRPINIGFGNVVAAGRIVAMVGSDSAPTKRMIQDARERGMLVDATQGRRTRAVIIADSGHVILSAILPETIAGRMSDSRAALPDCPITADRLVSECRAAAGDRE